MLDKCQSIFLGGRVESAGSDRISTTIKKCFRFRVLFGNAHAFFFPLSRTGTHSFFLPYPKKSPLYALPAVTHLHVLLCFKYAWAADHVSRVPIGQATL